MDKKRLLELAGVPLNEAASTEEILASILTKLQKEANDWYGMDRDDMFIEDPQEIGDMLTAIYDQYRNEPVVRRIFVGMKRQRGE